jgi:hypothetical protein
MVIEQLAVGSWQLAVGSWQLAVGQFWIVKLIKIRNLLYGEL